jgi:hypothetical protein
MGRFNKASGSGVGGTLGTGLSVIIIWLLTDVQFVGISMPEAVQIALSGIIATICGIFGTYLAPMNVPPS